MPRALSASVVRCVVWVLAVVSTSSCGDASGPAHAPSIRIVAPEGGATVLAGDTVVFRAEASDSVDGALTGSSIAWLIDSLPAFGSGDSTVLRLTVVGSHVVTARATNRSGTAAVDRVPVEVKANSTPFVTSSALSPYVNVFSTDTVRLLLKATDIESGPITGSFLSWVSNLEGPLGAGDTVVVPPGKLRVGTHILTGYAVDPQGSVDSTSATLSVLTRPERLLWDRVYPGATTSGSLAVLETDGSVVFGLIHPGCGTCLFDVDASGKERWRVKTGQISSHSTGLTVAPDGVLYVVDFGGMGYGIGPDGVVRWQQRLSGFDPHGRFALGSDGALYATGQGFSGTSAIQTGGVLQRISPTDGTILWTIKPTSLRFHSYGAYVDPTGRPVGAPDGRMVWAQPNGTMVQQDTAHLGWLNINRGSMGADGAMYLVSGFAEALMAMASDGTRLWTATFISLASFITEPVVDAQNVVYVAGTRTGGAMVQALRGSDGFVLWTTQLPSTSALNTPSIALTANSGLVASVGRDLYALSTQGAIRWQVNLPGLIDANLVVGGDGTIYCVTNEGRVLAIRGDAPLDATAPWPNFRRDNRATSSVQR